MFGLGWMEISLILVIALMVFGPKKLPELARKLGEGIREFRNASDSFKATVNTEAERQPVYDEHEGPLPPEQLTDGKPEESPTDEKEKEKEKEKVVGPTQG